MTGEGNSPCDKKQVFWIERIIFFLEEFNIFHCSKMTHIYILIYELAIQ